jgi:hypothetical protein
VRVNQQLVPINARFPILTHMANLEKIILAVCLFVGFLWLRNRSKSIDLENQMMRSILGVFVLLPAALIGEKYLFTLFHLGLFTDILIKSVAILATFLIIGFGFLRSETVSSPPAAPE